MPEDKVARKQFEELYIFVYLQVSDNPFNLPLREFLRRAYSKPSIDSQKTVFELMEENLQLYKVGSQEALIFVGSLGESPQKSIFFSHKGKVYTITLYGGPGGTGSTYSATAEKIFDLMVSSIEMR